MNEFESKLDAVDKKKLKRAVKYDDQKDFSMYEEVCDMNEHLMGIHENLEMIAKKPEMEMPEKMKVEMEGVSVITLKGDKGDIGEQGEKGEKGKDGKDGLNGKDGKNGIDGVNGIDGKDGKNGENGKDGSPDTPEQIVDKLNTLENVLDISVIKGLSKEIKRIESLPRGGGGTSAIGVAQAFKYIAHTEEPSGLINGVNTIYTVKNTIWWIAGFTLNGEQIAELPNYTVSGRTITFNSALPAVYSGKDFEIKYIGT